jgi:hypothetical protein
VELYERIETVVKQADFKDVDVKLAGTKYKL